MFENIVKCISKNPLKSQPEDGCRKKVKTCSCHDVLYFKRVFYTIKVVLDSLVLYCLLYTVLPTHISVQLVKPQRRENK